jgi:hypothetical protein
MPDVGVSPQVSPPCRRAQSPRQMWSLATSPYNYRDIPRSETSLYLRANVRITASDMVALAFKGVVTLLVTLCREDRLGGAARLERSTLACAVGAMRGDPRIGYALLMRKPALDAGIVSALLVRYCP